jgi:hypothetical protein
VLDNRWSAWFEGLQLSNDEPGQTTIAGSITDQAALHGLLAKIRDLALPLLSVRRIDPDRQPDRGSDATPAYPDAPASSPTATIASGDQEAAKAPTDCAHRPAHAVGAPASVLR